VEAFSIKGQIISGKFGEILVRQKHGEKIELGELLVADNGDSKCLFQVFDLVYGSQLSQQQLELISGMKLESDIDAEFFDVPIRNYVLAKIKPLIIVTKNETKICKELPLFFSNVRRVTKEDFDFILNPNTDSPLLLGKLRSGSNVLDVDVSIDGKKAFQHHILIGATTGRGKSNLVKNILLNCLNYDYAGILVLDPHDEYYGRNGVGLKDSANKEKVIYYSKNPLPGTRTLKIGLKNIRPGHFNGIVNWSDAQLEAIYTYYKKFGDNWIESVVLEKEIENFQPGTLSVVRRKIMSLLNLHKKEEGIHCSGIFDLNSGQTTIKDIVKELEHGRIVIIDTSSFPGTTELLVGSMIASEIFNRYRNYKFMGVIDEKPVVSIVLEEAPRVLGKDVLAQGTNIFETIAREGRKFKVGLTAITQLPSLIPKEILANINTKVILGIEMASERQAIIESAAQDLSEDSRNIASLDIGEAIITSTFSRFAIPIKIPFFENVIKNNLKEKKIESYQKRYLGIEIV